jgi:hypothetical protein
MSYIHGNMKLHDNPDLVIPLSTAQRPATVCNCPSILRSNNAHDHALNVLYVEKLRGSKVLVVVYVQAIGSASCDLATRENSYYEVEGALEGKLVRGRQLDVKDVSELAVERLRDKNDGPVLEALVLVNLLLVLRSS